MVEPLQLPEPVGFQLAGNTTGLRRLPGPVELSRNSLFINRFVSYRAAHRAFAALQ